MDGASAPQSGADVRAAAMWRYAGVFLGIYGGLAVMLGVLVNVYGVERPSWIGIVAIVLAAQGVGWVFARRRRRLFEPSERRRLTAICLAIVLAFEVLSYLGYPEYFQGLPLSWVVGAFAFAIGLNTLVVWTAFKYTVPRAMERQLTK